MDPWTLERLMIDRSLGALSPDVETLLAAHLERNPPDAEAAAAFDRTVGIVGLAIEAPVDDVAALPAMSFRDIERREQLLQWRRRAINVTGMAAALVFGCIVGAKFFGGIGARSSPFDGAIVRTTDGATGHLQLTPARFPRHESPGEIGPAGGGIWSAERLLRNARSASRDRDRTRLIWDSPLRKPRFGEQT